MTKTHPHVITIRGAPGVGKSHTAKCLATHFPKGVRVEVDMLRAMVISVDWTNQEEHINMLGISSNMVHGFLKLGYRPVIVVDTFSGNKLNKFLSDLRGYDSGLAVRSFTLITTPEVLRLRVENRPPDQFKDIVICQKINSDVMKHFLPAEQLIDNTELTPEETAETIMQHCLRTANNATTTGLA